jgi:hypothetical protein
MLERGSERGYHAIPSTAARDLHSALCTRAIAQYTATKQYIKDMIRMESITMPSAREGRHRLLASALGRAENAIEPLRGAAEEGRRDGGRGGGGGKQAVHREAAAPVACEARRRRRRGAEAGWRSHVWPVYAWEGVERLRGRRGQAEAGVGQNFGDCRVARALISKPQKIRAQRNGNERP